MSKTPNPQGKGLIPVLESLSTARPGIVVPPKHVRQVRSELFTSLFILGSDFKFKPVAGRSYWLYRQQGRFKLFLMAPHEWCTRHPGQFVGECVLQPDLTWTLNLDEAVACDPHFLAFISEQQQRFEAVLESAESLESALPTYDPELRFYGRVLAYGLSASLRASMTLSGINALTYREAQGLLAEAAGTRATKE